AFHFATNSGAIAHLDGAHESLLLAIIENGRGFIRAIAVVIAQVVIHGRRFDNSARIQQSLRIEHRLYSAEGLVDLRSEHLAIPFAAHQAVAVFAAEGAAEFEDEVGDLFHDAAHFRLLGLLLEIDEGANVQAADAGVTIKGAVSAMLLQGAAETLHE